MRILSLAQIVLCNILGVVIDICSCQLFTSEEFLAFEYLDDIWFQQFDGPANKFSATLG